jgi:hypothetical protein
MEGTEPKWMKLGLIRKRAPFVIIWGALPLASCF